MFSRAENKRQNSLSYVTVSACSSLSASRYSRAARATATAADAIVAGERADIKEKERERTGERESFFLFVDRL